MDEVIDELLLDDNAMLSFKPNYNISPKQLNMTCQFIDNQISSCNSRSLQLKWNNFLERQPDYEDHVVNFQLCKHIIQFQNREIFDFEILD